MRCSHSRIAFIGCGAVVERHYLPCLQYCQNVTCELLVDQDLSRAQRLAGAYGIRRAERDLQAAAGLIDGVIVAVPNHLHADVTIQALHAGWHVLCEKPLARTTDEVNSMMKVAEDCDRSVFAAMVCRRYPAIREAALNQIHRMIGEVREIDASYGSPLDWPVHSLAFYDRGVAGGGAMLDLGSHLVDALFYVLRDPAYEVLSYYDDAEAGVEAEAEAHLRLFLRESHAAPHCTVRVSRLRRMSNSLVFRGEEGVLELPLDPFAPPVLGFRQSRWTMSPEPRDLVSCFAEQISEFGRAIQGEVTSLPRAESQLHSIGLIESLYRTRQPLRFPWDE